MKLILSTFRIRVGEGLIQQGLFVTVLSLSLVLGLTSCGKQSEPESSQTTNGPEEGISIKTGESLGKGGVADEASTKSASKVTARIEGAPSSWEPGGESEMRLVLEIKDGWHVNAHPASLDYLIPTEFELKSKKAVLESIVYPEGESFSLAQMEEPIKVYTGKVEIAMRIRLASDLSSGKHTLNGSVRVQACDDKRCLAPGSVPTKLTLNVTGETDG